jgi:5-methylcytosine-specific restriction endonuclease McrA
MKETLNHHVLVLNRSWVVIGTTTVKDAVVLMSRDSARGVCTESFVMYSWEDWVSAEANLPKVDFYIKTPSLSIPAPQVVILTNYNDVAKTSIKFSTRALYRRDSFTCQYCYKKFRGEDLSIDHVLPRSRRGPTSWENCVASCFKCNNKKAAKTPAEAGLKLLAQPKKPRWNPVFHIKADLRPDSWSPLLKKTWT